MKQFTRALAIASFLFSTTSLQAFWLFRTKPHDARSVQMTNDTYPVVVVGSGVGGLTAGLYSALANRKTLLIEGPTPGGLITQSHSVRNWPGELEITGHKLIDQLRSQVVKRGVDIIDYQVDAIDTSVWPYRLSLSQVNGQKRKTVSALSVVLALGAKNRYLGVPGEKKYWSTGVSNCAVCDGSLYQGKDVVVVGGGDSAMVEASYLSGIAKSVTVLVRRGVLRATGVRVEEVKSLPNVKIRFNTTIQQILGDKDGVTHVMVKGPKGAEKFKTDGVFLAIGFDPNTSLFKGQFSLDSAGYLKVDDAQMTSKPGIFGIGDVTDPVFKQAITAAGDGCKAAMGAMSYLESVRYRSDWQAPRTGPTEKPTVQPVVKPKQRRTQKPAGAVISINGTEDFNTCVKQSKIPVVVDMYATWCGPCKRLAPILTRLAKEFAGKVRIVKVNIDSNRSIAQQYGVRGIPVLMYFKNGSKVSSSVGLKPENVIRAQIKQLLR